MKNLILSSLFFFLLFPLYQCSKTEEEVTPKPRTMASILPEKYQQWGELVAESLTTTVKHLNKNKISLSNHDAVYTASENAVWQVMEAKGLVEAGEREAYAEEMKTSRMQTPSQADIRRLAEYSRAIRLAKFSRRLSDLYGSLTPRQIDILQSIENVRVSSRSYEEFSDFLIIIVGEIPRLVPRSEQDLLYRVIANTYYSLRAVNDLVRQDLLDSVSSQQNGLRLRIKLRDWWKRWGRCLAGILGNAGGGFLTGAAAGSAVPGIGTTAGGIIGAVAGGRWRPTGSGKALW